MKTLGLDLGGTKIAAAVVEEGKILTRRQLPTPQTGFEAVADALAEAAEAVLADYPEVNRIGIGSPGPIDFRQGKVLFAPNIPGMENAYIVKALESRLGNKATLENDANAAGYAEHLYGAAHDLESSVFVTISTGIGGGIFMEDKVLHGADGIAGEIGHMILQIGGPLCGCGQQGCWEAIASGRSIARDASFSYGEPLTTEEVFARARAGEYKALQVINNAARFTGLGLVNIHKAVNPAGFVIGGGMSQVGSFYFDKIQVAVAEFTVGFPPVEIRMAKLGTDAGVIGAASVALLG